MPKQLYKITQFHGGLNSNSDARDIAENELSEATDIMVDELGKIRLMGGINTSTDPPDNAAVINPGYGLFQFSHDRTGGHLVAADLAGTHTGSNNEAVELTDSAAAFTSGLVGATVHNLTDGSTGTVASVDSGTVLTVDDLTGGTGDDFDNNDIYVDVANEILALPLSLGILYTDTRAYTASQPWSTTVSDLQKT